MSRALSSVALVGFFAVTLATACEKRDTPIAPADPTASTTPLSIASAPPSRDAPDSGKRALTFITPPQDRDVLSIVRTERLRAKAEGRTLVVYAGAPWCDPCRRFHEAAHAGKLDAPLANVTLVEFSADDDGERLAAAGYTFKFIPYFARVGVDGSPDQSYEVKGRGDLDEIVDTVSRWTK